MYNDDKRFEGILTDNEVLFNKVTHNRLLELIEKYPVVECIESLNSYGEFLFITLRFDNDDCVTFYGLGLHEQRDYYFTDEWHMYETQEDYPPMDKSSVLSFLKKRKQEIETKSKNHHQSNRGAMFTELADVADDDGIMAMFEDLGY